MAGLGRAFALVVGLLCLSLVLPLVDGRSEEGVDFTLHQRSFVYLARFGFFDGGSIDLNVTLTDGTYQGILVACPEGPWREVRYNQTYLLHF